MPYTICSRFKGEHIVYAGYTICTSREHIVYGAFCGSTGLIGKVSHIVMEKHCRNNAYFAHSITKDQNKREYLYLFIVFMTMPRPRKIPGVTMKQIYVYAISR